MVSHYKDPSLEEILHFFRFSVTESAAGVFTQSSFSTNLSMERGVIWEIHFIEIEILPNTIDTPGAGLTENTVIQITAQSKTALVNLDDADLISRVSAELTRSSAIGTDAGPIYYGWVNPIHYDFNPPILFGSQTIYVAVDTTSGAAQSVRGRVGYTILPVSEKFYYQVATALLN